MVADVSWADPASGGRADGRGPFSPSPEGPFYPFHPLLPRVDPPMDVLRKGYNDNLS